MEDLRPHIDRHTNHSGPDRILRHSVLSSFLPTHRFVIVALIQAFLPFLIEPNIQKQNHLSVLQKIKTVNIYWQVFPDTHAPP